MSTTAVRPAPVGVAGRDHSIDTVRVVAMGGVVLGHWLVTGLVLGRDGLHTASPLAAMPGAAPVSWLLQTLGLFFFAGGFAATRTRGSATARASGVVKARAGGSATARAGGVVTARAGGVAGARAGGSAAAPAGGFSGAWAGGGVGAGARAAVGVRANAGLRRTVGAAVGLVLLWAAVIVAGAAAGVSGTTLHTVFSLAVGPLWFLLPYLLLRGGAPRLRHGAVPLIAVAFIAGVDGLGLASGGGPADAVFGYLAVVVAWSVPWWLGGAVADGRVGGLRHGVLLGVVGGVVLVLLVTVGGYPVSAVGVPGERRSNLDPPSLAALALAVAQIGAFLILRHRQERRRARAKRAGPAQAGRAGRARTGREESGQAENSRAGNSRARRVVGALNRGALRVYLGHQSVLLAAAGASVWLGWPGLVGAPGDGWWVVGRVAWLPVLVMILAVVARSGRRGSGPPVHSGGSIRRP